MLLPATYDQFPDLSLLAEGLIVCNEVPRITLITNYYFRLPSVKDITKNLLNRSIFSIFFLLFKIISSNHPADLDLIDSFTDNFIKRLMFFDHNFSIH